MWLSLTARECPLRPESGQLADHHDRSALCRFCCRSRSRHACGRERRGPCHELGQPAEVLSDRCERELELSPARSAQSQAAEPQDTLEMRKQHLDALSVMARSLECFSLG